MSCTINATSTISRSSLGHWALIPSAAPAKPHRERSPFKNMHSELHSSPWMHAGAETPTQFKNRFGTAPNRKESKSMPHIQCLVPNVQILAPFTVPRCGVLSVLSPTASHPSTSAAARWTTPFVKSTESQDLCPTHRFPAAEPYLCHLALAVEAVMYECSSAW